MFGRRIRHLFIGGERGWDDNNNQICCKGPNQNCCSNDDQIETTLHFSYICNNN